MVARRVSEGERRRFPRLRVGLPNPSQRCRPGLKRLAQRKLRLQGFHSTEDVERVVGQTIVAALGSFENGYVHESLELFDAWLRGILKRRIRSLPRYVFASRRDRRREQRLDDRLDNGDETRGPLAELVANTTPPPEDVVNENETHDARKQFVFEMLCDLDRDSQLILLAHYYADFTFDQIAKLLNKTEAAAKMQASRLRTRLRS